jgi:hypothetical protein
VKPPTVTIVTPIAVTPERVAEMFASLDDDGQAQVFVEVAKIAALWTDTNMDQWSAVGAHLRDCECSTDGAREIVERIAFGIRFGLPFFDVLIDNAPGGPSFLGRFVEVDDHQGRSIQVGEWVRREDLDVAGDPYHEYWALRIDR